MALLFAGMIKTGNAAGTLSLTAQSGTSLKVRKICWLPAGTDTYMTVRINRRTVGFFRGAGKAGNHIAYPARNVAIPDNALPIAEHNPKHTIFELMARLGKPLTYPVAEGETMTLTHAANASFKSIIYDIYDAGDCKATDENGSMCNTYTFLQYLDSAVAVRFSATWPLDVSLTPAEFPNFPALGSVVPAGYTAKILGILGAPITSVDGAAAAFRSTYLSIIAEREVMFDEDRNGIPFPGLVAVMVAAPEYFGLYSMIGPLTDTDQALPLMFDPPLEFTAGSEVDMSVACSGGAVVAGTAAPLDVTPIMQMVRA